MRTSAFCSILFWAVYLATWLFGARFIGDGDLLRDEGTQRRFHFVASLQHLSFFGALIATAVYAFQTIMEKTVNRNTYHGPVDQSKVTASHNATVATGGSRIDQRDKHIDQRVSSSVSGEFHQAVNQVQAFIDQSQVPDRDRSHAALLLEAIKQQALAPRRDKAKLSAHLKELGHILEAAKPVAQGVSDAVKIIRDVAVGG
jgi:hypothetical protein